MCAEGIFVANTLKDWDPSGRWFFTDAFLGRSSIGLRRDVADVVSDTGWKFTVSDSELFQTELREQTADFAKFRYTQRISNLRDDGTLRYDLVFCQDETCDVCTARMIPAERHDPLPADKIALVAAFDPPAWETSVTLDVDVVGNTAYVVRRDGLSVVDITDPSKPVLRGFYKDADGYTNDVVIVGNYAVVASTPVKIVDVSNPDSPTLAGQLPVEAHTVFADGNRIYFGSLDGTAPVYDFTDPVHPVRLGAYNTGASYVHDLYIEGGIAYLNAWEKGFFVVDYTNPAAPALLGHWQSPQHTSHSSWVTTLGGRRVAIHGEESYGAHLSVLDVDPASPQFMRELGTYQTREYVSIHNVTAFGSKAYITYYQDGVRILDLANPASPALLGYYNTWDPTSFDSPSGFYSGAIGIDVDLARRLLFVADTARGLLILRDET